MIVSAGPLLAVNRVRPRSARSMSLASSLAFRSTPPNIPASRFRRWRKLRSSLIRAAASRPARSTWFRCQSTRRLKSWQGSRASLTPPWRISSSTWTTPVHQPQQRLTIQLAEHGGSETIAEQSRLLRDLRGRHQLAGREAAVKRCLQLVSNARFKNRSTPCFSRPAWSRLGYQCRGSVASASISSSVKGPFC